MTPSDSPVRGSSSSSSTDETAWEWVEETLVFGFLVVKCLEVFLDLVAVRGVAGDDLAIVEWEWGDWVGGTCFGPGLVFGDARHFDGVRLEGARCERWRSVT